MKYSVFFLACFCCFSIATFGQITVAPSTLNFFTVVQGNPVSNNLTITNNSSVPLVVTDIDAYHRDAFHIQDTAFTVAPGGSHVVAVVCDPRHNVRYADWILIKSSSHPFVPHAFAYAFAKYPEAYYDATQDLYNEDLKAALKTTITTGYTTFSYNDARDRLFMNVENQAVNGQGASQNTLECIYTGFLAVGYTNRADAQTTYNMNTEHTMPQSLFSSNIPMYSDMHHLFVSTAASNSERSNNPFGIVTNPSWSQGGSKSNGNVFEPRDEQKGASARALLYFYLRYQDYSGFICGMEPILRTWNANFAPDSVDVKRNDDVESYQHNRNPFVDHPEFMERITSLCSVNNGSTAPIAEYVSDTLQYGSVANGNTMDGYYVIANQGINPMNLSNLTVSGAEFSLVGATNLVIPKDSLRKIWVKFSPSGANQNFSGQLTFNTDAPATASRSVQLLGTSIPVSLDQSFGSMGISIFPQPAHDQVQLKFSQAINTQGILTIWNLNGQKVRTTNIAADQSAHIISLNGLSNGMYILRLQVGDQQFAEKLIVE